MLSELPTFLGVILLPLKQRSGAGQLASSARPLFTFQYTLTTEYCTKSSSWILISTLSLPQWLLGWRIMLGVPYGVFLI